MADHPPRSVHGYVTIDVPLTLEVLAEEVDGDITVRILSGEVRLFDSGLDNANDIDLSPGSEIDAEVLFDEIDNAICRADWAGLIDLH